MTDEEFRQKVNAMIDALNQWPELAVALVVVAADGSGRHTVVKNVGTREANAMFAAGMFDSREPEPPRPQLRLLKG